VPSLSNQLPPSSGPKRYRPAGMSSARLESVTRQSRSGPSIRRAKASNSGARWAPSAITSVLMPGVARTNCSIPACIGVPHRARNEATELIAHQK
jgi:hypothetical protein